MVNDGVFLDEDLLLFMLVEVVMAMRVGLRSDEAGRDEAEECDGLHLHLKECEIYRANWQQPSKVEIGAR